MSATIILKRMTEEVFSSYTGIVKKGEPLFIYDTGRVLIPTEDGAANTVTYKELKETLGSSVSMLAYGCTQDVIANTTFYPVSNGSTPTVLEGKTNFGGTSKYGAVAYGVEDLDTLYFNMSGFAQINGTFVFSGLQVRQIGDLPPIGSGYFHLIDNVVICNCPNLEEVYLNGPSGTGFSVVNVDIENCPKLKRLYVQNHVDVLTCNLVGGFPQLEAVVWTGAGLLPLSQLSALNDILPDRTGKSQGVLVTLNCTTMQSDLVAYQAVVDLIEAKNWMVDDGL